MKLEIFEFSQRWSTSYFLFFVVISLVVTLLCQKAAKAKNNRAKNKCKIYYFGAFLILFIIATFRTRDVGADTEEYVEFFENVCKEGFIFAISSKFELLFKVYIFIISRFSSNYTILFACNALITVGVLIKYISSKWNYGDSFVLLPLFIIGFQYELSTMRSALATACILASFLLLDKGKYMKSIFLTCIGALFHTTAIINLYLILFQIILKKKRVWTAKILVAWSIVCIVLLNASIYYLQAFLSTTRYKGYVKQLGNGWLGNWNLILAALFSAVIIAKAYKSGKPKNSEDIVNLLVLSMLPVYVKLNAYRVPKYYLMCRCATYKTVCTNIEKKQSSFQSKILVKFIEFVCLIFCLLYFFSRNMSGSFYEFKF